MVVIPAVAGTGVIVSDTCLTGLMGADVEMSRPTKNDSLMGIITIYASDGTTLLGAGPVRCNKGTLASSPVVVTDGTCRYTVSNKVAFTVTADNTYDIVNTQSRSATMSEPVMSCMQRMQPVTCTFAYRVSQKL